MASDDSIVISVEVDGKQVDTALKNIESQAKRSGKAAGDNLEGGLLQSVGKLKTALLGLAAAFGAAFTLREAINAAAEQEQAIQNLNAALSTAGKFTPEVSKSFIELADSLQAVTGVAGTQVLGLSSLSLIYARTTEQAKALTKAALDLAAATGVDTNIALDNLGKTLTGNIGSLKKIVPELKNLTEEQLRSGEAIRIVQQRFEGLAQSQLQTFSGSLRGLSNNFGGFLEQIGNFIVKSPSLIVVFNTLSGLINDFGKALSNFRGDSDFLKPLISNILEFSIVLNQLVIGPTELFFRGLLAGFDVLAAGVGAIGAVIAQAVEGYVRIAEALGLGGAVTSKLTEFTNYLKGEFVTAANAAADSTSKVFSAETTTGIDNFLKAFKEAVAQAGPLASQLANSVNGGFEKVQKKTKEAEFDIKTRIGNGISSAIQAGVTALAQGENAFAAFGKAVLGIIGDLAIQIGTFWIINSSALAAFKLLDPSGGLAFGFALVALGTLLKSLSGGAGSIAGPAPTTPGVTGTPNDVTQPIDEQTQIERSSQVVVNVEGTVLDPVGVGTQIAQLLKEVTDSNDIQVRA